MLSSMSSPRAHYRTGVSLRQQSPSFLCFHNRRECKTHRLSCLCVLSHDFIVVAALLLSPVIFCLRPLRLRLEWGHLRCVAAMLAGPPDAAGLPNQLRRGAPPRLSLPGRNCAVIGLLDNDTFFSMISNQKESSTPSSPCHRINDAPQMRSHPEANLHFYSCPCATSFILVLFPSLLPSTSETHFTPFFFLVACIFFYMRHSEDQNKIFA